MTKPHDANDVGKILKAEIAELVRDRVKHYREQRQAMEAWVRKDPAMPLSEKEADRQQVEAEVQKLTDVWNEVVPYIRKIRPLIADVLEHNRLSACYLLFGKVSQGFAATFLLAREGFHYEVMEIIRSTREAIDLIALFLEEAEDSVLIKRWFEGEIVENAKAREAIEKKLKEAIAKSGVPLTGMKAGIYGALSKFSHVSYIALLEAYDIFHHDFDFDRIAGYHWVVNSSLPYLSTEVEATLIALKGFYASVKDRDSYLGLDALVRKYYPRLYDEEARKARKAEIMTRFKKQ